MYTGCYEDPEYRKRGTLAAKKAMYIFYFAQQLDIRLLQKSALCRLSALFDLDHGELCGDFIKILRMAYRHGSYKAKDDLWYLLVHLGQRHARGIVKKTPNYKEELRQMPGYVYALAMQPPQRPCSAALCG